MPLSNFVSNVRRMWLGTTETYDKLIMPSILSGTPFDISQSDKVSTVFTCIKILSETISRIPLNIYDNTDDGRIVDKTDYRYPILHYNPNNWTSNQVFIQALEYWRNLKGNSFARIYRTPAGLVKSLVLIPPSKVTGYTVVNDELYYIILNDSNIEETINSTDILHFRGITKDGIWGINPLEAVRQNVSASFKALNAVDSFYSNNAMSPKAIKSTISGANQKAMLDAVEEFKQKYAGPSNAGQMIVLPPNSSIEDLTLNFADAEFVNTMKLNAQTIAALFGIPSWMVGILEQTKYSSVETTAMEFKNTTLAPIGRMYRQEFESKLLTTEERLAGKSIEFNFNAFVELDSTTRIANLKNLLMMGAITPNDICRREGYETFEGGDLHVMPANYVPIEKLGEEKTH